GLVYGDLQQWEDCISAHEKSVKIARQLFDQGALALRLGHLGGSYFTQKRYAEAIPSLQESAALHSQMGQQIEASLRWSMLGDAAAEVGRDAHPDPSAHEQYRLALEAYGQAMEHMRALNDTVREADTIRKVGMVLADVGQYDDAQQYLGAAEQMFAALGLNQQAERSRQTLKRLIEFLKEE
ncbi:MAG: tetratricopeptide repeat protein, partial [Anaerolineae bacterium]|nr:tetratricopeptide repeat protein [Anaerolineae bacterium]